MILMAILTDGLSALAPVALFNLYSVATNPDSQEKIYNEVIEAAGKDEGKKL